MTWRGSRVQIPSGPSKNTGFYTVNGLQITLQKRELDTLTPYDNFLFGLKAKETKRQYPHRLDKFLSYLGLEGTIEEKCNQLYDISKDVHLLHSQLIHFINTQKQRIEDKDKNLTLSDFY